MHVVVCGGGVIGAATAYYLTELGVEVTLVERCEIGAAASGKAGGFLARDWCDGNAMGPLARASFDLHAELAEGLDTDYGYRRVDTLMVAGADEGSVATHARFPASAWLDGNCAVHGRIGTPETTAQVEPGAFTRALVDAAGRGGGARVRIGAVEGLLAASGARGAVAGVVVDGERVAADAVVLAMGPWTALARAWLPLPPIGGLKGFSITLRPDFEVPAEMLFCEYRTASGEVLSPEIYPPPGRRGVGVRNVGRPAGPGRSRGRPGGRRALRRAPADCRHPRDGAWQCGDHPPPGVLPPDLRRRDAPPRAGARRPTGRVRRDRPQLLGDPERARERQGDGGARRDRGGALRRPRALRAGPPPRGRVAASITGPLRPSPPVRITSCSTARTVRPGLAMAGSLV